MKTKRNAILNRYIKNRKRVVNKKQQDKNEHLITNFNRYESIKEDNHDIDIIDFKKLYKETSKQDKFSNAALDLLFTICGNEELSDIENLDNSWDEFPSYDDMKEVLSLDGENLDGMIDAGEYDVEEGYGVTLLHNLDVDKYN